MKISFLGAARVVTGSCFLVETSRSRFIIDCGLFQGNKALRERNYLDFSIDPGSVDFLILTHAHIDHSGLIPKFCKQGFTGPIYCQNATAELCAVVLPDSGYIQESEVERKNRKLSRAGKPLLEPIYTVNDAINSLGQLEPVDYDTDILLAEDVRLCFREAGHILGAAIVELWIDEEGVETKLVFSGDIGQGQQPIVRDPAVINEADYVVMESTYGDRLHEPPGQRTEELMDIINHTMAKGGNLIIPAFAVERTQDLLYDLNILYSQGRLDPSIDIYIDSPLAIAATEIFRKNIQYYSIEAKKFVDQGQHPLEMPQLKYSNTQEESIRLNQNPGGAIILSASGMCDAGRIKHHLRHNLWRAECTILFVGYQAEGTLGRRLLEGEKTVTIHGEQVAVKADIRRIEAFSAHADQSDLVHWVAAMHPSVKQVFLVHGEEHAQLGLAQKIAEETGFEVQIPELLEEVTLRPGVETMITAFNQNAKIEASYWQLRHELNNYYKDARNSGNYNSLLNMIKQVKDLLKQA